MIAFVSSVNYSYHQLCGREMVKSFLSYVEEPIWLQLWCDGSLENRSIQDYWVGTNTRVIRYDLGQVDGITTFLRRAAEKIPLYSSDPLERLRLGGEYNYRKDVRTFGLKGMALTQSLWWKDPRYLFWTDADTIFLQPLSAKHLLSLFHGAGIVYFGRENPHTETGFIGFDNTAKGFLTFVREYTKCWSEGKIFDLSGWTDCDAFDYALAEAKKDGLVAKSLSTQPSGHVIANSPLGAYINHRKGLRKL